MDNVLAVQIPQAERTLVQDAAQLVLIDAQFGGGVQLQQVLLHVLEDHPDALSCAVHVQHPDDVGVIQPR